MYGTTNILTLVPTDSTTSSRPFFTSKVSKCGNEMVDDRDTVICSINLENWSRRS